MMFSGLMALVSVTTSGMANGRQEQESSAQVEDQPAGFLGRWRPVGSSNFVVGGDGIVSTTLINRTLGQRLSLSSYV